MKRFLKKVKQYRQIYYSRQLLKGLDARALKDIGLTRSEALREARRPFWSGKAVEEESHVESKGLFLYQAITLVLVLGMGLTACFNIN
ncbi:DUF1127 domain-containing protein [uncultured Amphritea sp.]|uniref:DUF1127 domain-containing protein n=1 Tax=uncultured Amphritea sp. TaxID=981605 RepID=UPI002611C38F|nr:DUF1127 domain-containing protein [uncultured Amphritea sp.]